MTYIYGSQGCTVSMTMPNPLLPDLTDPLCPTKSPLCGMALPDFETLAPTTTSGNLESFISSDMAVLSSRMKLMGNSLALCRKIASGMRGPSKALANINTVSLGWTLPARAGARLTFP